jgi:hypothetical protein
VAPVHHLKDLQKVDASIRKDQMVRQAGRCPHVKAVHKEAANVLDKQWYYSDKASEPQGL